MQMEVCRSTLVLDAKLLANLIKRIVADGKLFGAGSDVVRREQIAELDNVFVDGCIGHGLGHNRVDGFEGFGAGFVAGHEEEVSLALEAVVAQVGQGRNGHQLLVRLIRRSGRGESLHIAGEDILLRVGDVEQGDIDVAAQQCGGLVGSLAGFDVLELDASSLQTQRQ